MLAGAVMLMGQPLAAHAGDLPKSFVGKDGARMVLIPGGSFMMGSNENDMPESQPVHKVFLDDFYIDEAPVTNRQFAAFLNDLRPPEGLDGDRMAWVVLRTDLEMEERKIWWPTEIGLVDGKYHAYEGFREYPVITASWDAANIYCSWAGKRMPTEAEWERAARSGIEQALFPWGDEIPTSGSIVFNRSWIKNLQPSPTGPVKAYVPNAYGVYDTAGLVWEWVFDWFHPEYYKESDLRNPRGPGGGEVKVLRGGSWYNPPMALRVGLRNYNLPTALDETNGFRCAADVEAANR